MIAHLLTRGGHAVAACAAFLLAVGCSDDPESTESTRVDQILELQGDATAGALVFEMSCGIAGSCHGPDGMSGAGTPFPALVSRGDASLLNTAINGSGAMIGLDDMLTNQEYADVLAYIRATFQQ